MSRAQRLIGLLCVLCCVGGAATALAAEYLPPALAFKSSVQALDARTIELRFTIAKGYYLYRDKFRVSSETPGVELGAPILPKGKEKNDETFGAVEVFYDEAALRLPVERDAAMPGALKLALAVSSQGCAEAGVCYPPQKQTLSVELPALDADRVPGAPGVSGASAVSDGAVSGNESGRIARLLGNAGVWLIVASFFGFGVLLSATPCVFPMLPIVSGIIVGAGRDGHGVSHARGFALSLAYVLGMAVTYAAAGVAAGLTGTLLSSLLQNAWALGGFALIFVVLALSMFGLFELQLPSFLQSRASDEAAHLKGGSLPAVGLMGALSALIVGPCVAAPLAGALLYIGQSGDALLGGIALFCMALGMGLPLLVIGASAGTLLPKSGPWMVAVKKVFGVALLASALNVVSPLLPLAVQMAGWALLLIVPAVYLRAIDPLPPHAGNWSRFLKGIGVAMLLCGAALLVGALSGASDPWQPLAALRGLGGASAGSAQAAPSTARLPFERVATLAELDARVRASRTPVMLDFYADWCVTCKQMERETFSDARVRARLAGWTLLQADVTVGSDDDRALLARFSLYGPPAIVFFDAQGRASDSVRIVGFQNADEFLTTLARFE
jgi:thiol:disulfide interchange protein DsbD